MRHLLWVFILAGCYSPAPFKGELVLPESFSYDGRKPILGDTALLRPVINFNEKMSRKDLTLTEDFANEVTLHLYNGVNGTISRDSLTSMFAASFSQLESLSLTVNAAIPVTYTDNGDQWVYSWVYQEVVGLNGQTEKIYLHEDFKFENGKIVEAFTFRRLPGVPKGGD